MQADLGWPEAGLDGWTLPLQVKIEADPYAVRRALMAIHRALVRRGVAQDPRDRLEMVLAELLNNITEHGYGPGGGGIEISLTLGDQVLLCGLEDRGAALPPAVFLTQKADHLPEGGREGGYGWRLIRAVAEELCYQRRDGVNRLSFHIGLKQSTDPP